MQKMNELKRINKMSMKLTKTLLTTPLYLTKEGKEILLNMQLVKDEEDIDKKELQEFNNMLYDYAALEKEYKRYKRECKKANKPNQTI